MRQAGFRRGVCVVAAAIALAASCGGKKQGNSGGGDAGTGVIVVDPRKAPAGAPESEPNDAERDAQLLESAAGKAEWVVDGALSAPKDTDWYKVVLPAGAERRVLDVELSAIANVDTVLEVRGPVAGEVRRFDEAAPGEREVLPNLGLAPGTVYFKVLVNPPKKLKKGQPDAGVISDAASRYTLRIREIQPMPGDELEPNDTAAFAQELKPGDAVAGYLPYRKDRDVYRVPLDGLPTGSALRVELDPPPGVTPELALIDAVDATMLLRRGRPKSPLIASGLTPRAGDPYAFLAVSAVQGRSIDEKYTLRVTVETLAAGSEREPNDTPASALALVPDDAQAPQRGGDGGQSGSLTAGDVDVYQLKVAEGQLATLEVIPEGDADVTLALLGDDGKELRLVDDGGAKASEILPSWAIPAADDLFVRVSSKHKTGDVSYRLTWALEPDTGAGEREPNDDAARASRIADGVASSMKGAIDRKGDKDLYRLTGVGPMLTVSVGGVPGLVLTARLYDDKKKKVAETSSTGAGGALTLSSAADPVRTYTLELSEKSGKAARPRERYEILVHSE